MIDSQQYNNLLAQGYSAEQINQAVTELQQEGAGQPATQTAAANPNRLSPFAVNPNDNMVKWQLELDEILERFEHFLRGDHLEYTPEGHKVWKPSKESEDHILNEHGVREVMKILSMYLNKNTILSNYDQEEIRIKVLDFGQEFKDYLFCTYEKIGLRSEHYGIIVREMVDTVHSAYNRSLREGERRSLREARQVTQTEQMAPNVNINPSMGRERGVFNPMRYVGTKQV